MAKKEYQINNTTYTFSKEKFQNIAQHSMNEKRKAGNKCKTIDFYSDLAEGIGVSSETVRKWYTFGSSTSPVDLAMVNAIADYFHLDDVTKLLEKKKEILNMETAIEMNTDRELVKNIFTALIDFVDWMVNDIEVEDGGLTISCHFDERFNKLLEIHTLIDKAALDAKEETIKKLHDIVLAYTENVMTSNVSSKWDLFCSDHYYDARSILDNGINYESASEEERKDDYGLDDYIKSIYPFIYDDDEDYLEIPFTYQFFYKREFAISLTNIFRNDFPEYFLYQ